MFDFYPRWEATFAQVQLVLFMLGMGATLSWRDFAGVLGRPGPLIVAFLGHILFMPLIAVGVNFLFGLTGGIALGLILTSAMPGGTLSKAFAYLGRGNVPLAIALSLVSTLATLVTVPATLYLLGGAYIPDDFTMPIGAIVFDVVAYLLVPLAVGMAIGQIFPTRRQAFSRLAIRLGFAVVVAMVVLSLGSGRIRPGSHGLWVPLAIIVFCLASMQANMTPFRILRWHRADKLVAGIEVTMRNMNLALLLKTQLFPDTGSEKAAELAGEVLFVILFYAAVAMVEGLILTLRFRRMARRVEARQAEAR
jgi:BASS family bile acid:Na+ symporter